MIRRLSKIYSVKINNYNYSNRTYTLSVLAIGLRHNVKNNF